LFRILRQCDVVLDIGGGDSFADIYGWRRFAQMMFQKTLVHVAGRPLVLAPQTIGPFAHRLRARIATGSIRRSALVATRDALSTKALRDMGFAGPIIEASDVALRLPYTSPAPRIPGGRVRVGINVSGLLMQGGYTQDNMFGLRADYAQVSRDLISAFLRHPDGCEVHLVPHVIAWGAETRIDDDMQVSRELAAAFPGTVVAPAFQTPSEAKSYIAGLDFFVGARMHACIAAFSSGVPVVPLAYSRKFAGLFGTLGYNHTVDCKTETAEAIHARVLAGYADRDRLAREAKAACETGLTRLASYEQALETLLMRIASSARRPPT
jgi:polysaccharide pyruvyl transferase WcaK-like protein